MKLPAVWMLAAFAAGIGVAERWSASPKLWAVVAWLGILCGGIFVAGFLSWRGSISVTWVFALVAWVAVGALAAGVE